MNEVQTMETTTCECKSFTSGIATGIGIVTGIGIAAVATGGLYYLLKKR